MNNKLELSTPSILIQHGYRYIELLGEGSNGKTYKSKNNKTGEIVAVKALKFSDNLKNYELFKREAETLKSIHTPGTPKFYDYITDNGEFTECWLVQEYVEGESLLEKMERGEKFTEIQTIEIIAQAAKIIHTLQTEYAPPIIHRDIKPSNILVRKTPKDNYSLCLIDFGAVANPQKRGLNSTVAGTAGYMAPEQLIGDCTIQSDYYALGATALHLLTGINPSEIPSDGFTLQFEENLKEKVPEIHKETIDLLRKLMAPNPDERPQNAKDLLKQISSLPDLIHSSITEQSNKLKRRINLLEKYESIPWNIKILALLIGVCLPCFLYIPNLSEFILVGIFIFTILFVIIDAFLTSRLQYKYTQKLNQLTNFHFDDSEIQKYAVIDDTSNLSNLKEATGEICCIIGDIVEYVVSIEDCDYTAFYRQNAEDSYKVGDKIKVKYGKAIRSNDICITSGIKPI